MDRKLLGIFSGTHLTIMALGAMVVPSVLVAAVTYNPVAIVDPVTGTKSQVDGARRLSVYDPVSGLSAYPGNFVRIYATCSASSSSLSYAPPSGKALIVRAVDWVYYNGSSGSDNYGYLYGVTGNISGVESSDPVGQKSSDLGNGYYVKNGETMTMGCSSAGSYRASITGYLVGAGAVPAVGTADAVGQSVGSPAALGGKSR